MRRRQTAFESKIEPLIPEMHSNECFIGDPANTFSLIRLIRISYEFTEKNDDLRPTGVDDEYSHRVTRKRDPIVM